MLSLAAIGKGGAFICRPGMWNRGAYDMKYWGHAGVFPFFFVKLFLLFVVIFLIVFLIIKLLAYKKAVHYVSGSKALDILKERYAKGEISEKEFKTMKKIILD